VIQHFISIEKCNSDIIQRTFSLSKKDLHLLIDKEYNSLSDGLYVSPIEDLPICYLNAPLFVFVDYKSIEDALYQLRYVKILMENALSEKDYFSIFTLVHWKAQILWFNQNWHIIPSNQLFFIFYSLTQSHKQHLHLIRKPFFNQLEESLYLWRKELRKTGIRTIPKGERDITLYVKNAAVYDQKNIQTLRSGNVDVFVNSKDDCIGVLSEGNIKRAINRDQILFYDGNDLIIFT
jgi:hypothetical protein